MEHNNLNERARKAISDFESIGPLETGAEWEQNLMAKLAQQHRRQPVIDRPAAYFAAVVICFLLLNFTLIFEAVKPAKPGRKEMMKEVAGQLLINPASVNY